MHISRRTLIRIISFIAAAVLVLTARNIQLMREKRQSTLTLNYAYSRAVVELSQSTDNINTTLEKELYAGTPELQLKLAEKLWRETTTAKAALEQLPVQQLHLDNTYKFLSQVGNYAMALSRKASNGESISDKEYKNLQSLHEFSKTLCDDMWKLEDSINSGEISLTNASNSMKSTNDEQLSAFDGLKEFEDEFEEYPTLIYDGPFSDNILDKDPKMTAKAQEVSQKTALQKASMCTGVSSTEFTDVSEEAGKMPSWVFSDNKHTLTCAVTKNGGYLSYFIKSRLVDNESLSLDEGCKKAEQFLADIGINSMKTTYYENYNGVLTVNFAYSDNDICVYTDLVKVSVALDNGEIRGYDARGFLVNHYKRSYSEDRISVLEAEKKLSPMLKVNSKQLAVIPSDGENELLCYEFKCSNNEGRNILVYINAVTGQEEQILILFESENGTLTM